MNINSYIDHTILKPTTTLQDVEQLCRESIQYQFAAVCVPPLFVKKAKALVVDTAVKVATLKRFLPAWLQWPNSQKGNLLP